MVCYRSPLVFARNLPLNRLSPYRSTTVSSLPLPLIRGGMANNMGMMAVVIDHHKNAHNCKVDVFRWNVVRGEEYVAVFELDCLVSPAIDEVTTIYPCGIYECSCCHSKHNFMGHKTPAFFDLMSHGIVCKKCIETTFPVSIYRLLAGTVRGPVIIAEGAPEVPMVQVEDERLVGATRATAIEEHKKTCLWIVQTFGGAAAGFHYMDGKNTKDLYMDMLARRVARRWKALVMRRRKWALSHVLCKAAGLDAPAAVALAKSNAVLI